MSGRASITIRSARSEPLKSGIRTSTVVSGSRRRISVMHPANASAPPLGRSSRSTEVITTCSSPIRSTASARRTGSSGSKAFGRAVGDRAVGAVPGADVAQDHEGGGLVLPAFPDVGAARLLADRVQPQLAHHGLDVRVVRAAGCLHLEPGWLARRCRRRGGGGAARRLGRRAGQLYQRNRHSLTLRNRGSSMIRAKASPGRRWNPPAGCTTLGQELPQAPRIAWALSLTSVDAGSCSWVGPR